MSIAIKQKDPGSVRTYTLDYATWLASIGTGLTIVGSSWNVPDGITQNADSFSSTTTTIQLSGGTDGVDYALSNTVTVSDGQSDQKLLIIQVREVELAASVLVATAGGASSNSYGTLAEAQTYFSRKLYTDAWYAADSEQQEYALLMATERLERLDYLGIVVTDTQALKWPRQLNESGDLIRNYATTTVPTPVKNAQFELAQWLLLTNGGTQSTGSAGDVESLKIGSSIEVKYTSGTSTSTSLSPAAVDSYGLPPSVTGLLSGLRLIPVLA